MCISFLFVMLLYYAQFIDFVCNRIHILVNQSTGYPWLQHWECNILWEMWLVHKGNTDGKILLRPYNLLPWESFPSTLEKWTLCFHDKKNYVLVNQTFIAYDETCKNSANSELSRKSCRYRSYIFLSLQLRHNVIPTCKRPQFKCFQILLLWPF
jgi:hypothetical protein